MQHQNTPKNNTNRKVHQSAWSAVCRFVADKGESYISPVAASLQGENIPLLFVLSQIQEQSRQDTKYKTQERQNTKQTKYKTDKIQNRQATVRGVADLSMMSCLRPK